MNRIVLDPYLPIDQQHIDDDEPEVILDEDGEIVIPEDDADLYDE